MTQDDEFSLIQSDGPSDPDEYGQGYPPEPPRRNWGWLITLGVLAFLGFGAGAAVVTLRDRMAADPTVTPTPLPVETEQPPWVATIVALSTRSGTPSPQATGSVTPSPSPSASPSPTTTPTPGPCSRTPGAAFAQSWSRELFGCPTADAALIWAAWEPFERGSMIWRSDTNRSYVFLASGSWQVIDSSWEGQGSAGRGNPPPGLTAPERGFGWVWSTRDEIFEALGWARDREKGFCAEAQEFEEGFFLVSSGVASCTADNLYNHASSADWRPTFIAAHESGVWSGAMGGETVLSAAPTRSISATARPDGNGVFRAASAGAIQVDGSLAEWPASGWSAIATAVEGSENYSGVSDLYGTFQTAWNDQGLLLAVQVQDDVHRRGPSGTDLWQGDALELHFDADLAGDYSDASASADDTQLGIAVTGSSTPELYRWLPLAQEGSLHAFGVGTQVAEGYVIEVLLPWDYLGVSAAQAGSSFGFNLSISDNDSDSRRQETVLSASPARTTYNDPTEWGTLLLLP